MRNVCLFGLVLAARFPSRHSHSGRAPTTPSGSPPASADNKDEGQTAPVVLAYCSCMNNKMSNNETRSITQWEKANPNAQEACSKQAGWGRK